MTESNPYAPPSAPCGLEPRPAGTGRGTDCRPWDLRSVAELVVYLLFAPVAGFVAFGAATMAYGLAFETYLMPKPGPSLSYGQQAAVSCLLVSALGAVAGLIVVVARFPMGWGALAAPLAGAALLAWAAVSWWQESVAEYGPDPSDSIVFVPMLGAPCLVILLTVVVWMTRVLPYLGRFA